MDRKQNEIDPLFNLVFEKRRKYPKRYLDYRKNWAICGMQHKVPEYPFNVDTELSLDCNLHCPQCMRTWMKKPPRDMMPFRTFSQIISESVNHPTFSCIKTNYRGESFLHPQIVMFLEYAREKGNFEIMTNSNGQYAVSTSQRLAPHLSEIAFSIDAHSQAVYTKLRPFGSLKRVQDNVKEMIRLRDTKFHDLRIRTAFVVQQKNAHEVDAFVKYWKNAGVDKITCNPCYQPAQRGDNRAIVKWIQNDDFVCPQLFQRIVVTANNKVLPCCGAFFEPEELLLGDYSKDRKTIYDYWHSDKMNQLRQLHVDHRYKENKTCASCALSFKPVANDEVR